MYKGILTILIAAFIVAGCGEKKTDENQTPQDNKKSTEYLLNVDQVPLPVGGVQALAKRITYPAEAKQNGVQGTVFVKAYISKEGNVDSTEVIKSVGYGCDEAAVEAIQSMKFEPGRNNGVAVPVAVSIPIKFKLE